MTKQVNKFSLEEILIGKIAKQTNESITVDDEIEIKVRTFLMKKDNILGL